MKFLRALQTLFTGFFLIIIFISLLTWLGFISTFKKAETSLSSDVRNNLEVIANSGNPDAQNKLGALLYVSAKKRKKDFSEAIDWLNKAAKQNHPVAQTNLAYAYKAGNGVTADNEKAIELFYQAGLNYLHMGFPMDAKDNIYSINQLNKSHPLKLKLVDAIKEYEENN